MFCFRGPGKGPQILFLCEKLGSSAGPCNAGNVSLGYVKVKMETPCPHSLLVDLRVQIFEQDIFKEREVLSRCSPKLKSLDLTVQDLQNQTCHQNNLVSGPPSLRRRSQKTAFHPLSNSSLGTLSSSGRVKELSRDAWFLPSRLVAGNWELSRN